MFRLKPLGELFALAEEKQVGTIVRVPLASGLLTGNYHKDSSFGAGDHRTYHRQGEAFDKGETFSGVDYGKGLEAVSALKKHFGTEELVTIALRWILMTLKFPLSFLVQVVPNRWQKMRKQLFFLPSPQSKWME